MASVARRPNCRFNRTAPQDWFCYIASHDAEHAAGLDRQTLQRLLALPGDLWLDVCGDGMYYQ